MLYYVYSIPYTNAREASENDLLFHVAVYAAADKYAVDELKIDAAENFKRPLKKDAWKDESFFQAITDGYELSAASTGASLRACIFSMCNAHLEELINKKEFVTALELTPSLSSKLLARRVQSKKTTDLGSLSTAAEQSIQTTLKVAFICSNCGDIMTESFWNRNKSGRSDGVTEYVICPNCSAEFNTACHCSQTRVIHI